MFPKPKHFDWSTAMNRIVSFVFFALIMSVSFNTVAHADSVSDLSVESIAMRATDQYSDAKTAAADIRTKAHNGKCSLIVVTGSSEAWHQDLYVKAVSDLGGGILTQTQVITDNANMTVLVTGMNPSLQLMEHNSMWWDEALTGITEGLDAFKNAAKTVGYTVENLGDIHCQSSSRFATRRAKVLEAQELRRKAAEAAAAAKALEAGAEAEEPKTKQEPKQEPKATEEGGKTSPA